MSFPDGFLWGVAAAAYQIEGAATADGRGPSVWDAFCARPGAVAAGQTGATACDHYHRYPADVALMADLGVRAYRFSISWPRVLPSGDDTINSPGLDFYDRLVDALLARGIQPWATLFHWDMPLALFHRGGWLNRASADWFAEYAGVLAKRLGDRVRHWMTLNEPQVYLALGHGNGIHAPGIKYAPADQLRACHHTLLAHGRAVQAIREHARKPVSVGWAPHASVYFPVSNTEADIAAARSLMHGERAQDSWHFSTAWYADPVIFGRYPAAELARFGSDLPRGFEKDLAAIGQPLDFFGVNIYQGTAVRAGADGAPQIVAPPTGGPITMFHWPVQPDALYWGPRFIHERYKLPIYVTENGCASMDWVHSDGRVHDPARIDFTTRYLCALRRAAADGVDIRGYFHWSILDNFEWAEGYRMRFGLVYVDYATLERIPKDSYAWYQQVILSNGGCLPERAAPLR